jgi:hypothetical protein
MKFSQLKQAIYENFVDYWREDGYTKSCPVSYFAVTFNQDEKRVKKAIRQMVAEGMLIVCPDTDDPEPHYRLSPMAYMQTIAVLEEQGLAPPPPDGISWVKFGNWPD